MSGPSPDNTGRSTKAATLRRMGIQPLTVDGLPSLSVSDEQPLTIGQALTKRMGYGVVTEESIAIFLDSYRKCGIIIRAAVTANLSGSTIYNLKKKDPEFAALMADAKAGWIAEFLDDPLRKIGFEGLPKYALGGQYRDQKIEVERVIAPQVTLAVARKFDPEYREKQELDVNHQGGVLVVHAPASSPEAWREKYANQKQPSPPPEIVADSPGGSQEQR